MNTLFYVIAAFVAISAATARLLSLWLGYRDERKPPADRGTD